MNKSYYFAELAAAYDAEIQDLLSDSEGKSALQARLAEKRRELKALLPMLEFSPEMVVPVFYDALSFTDPHVLAATVCCEPEDGDFPAWDHLSPVISLANWALPLLETVLAEAAGDHFMVTVAGLEFLRKYDSASAAQADVEEKDEEDADAAEQDLAEAGDDWLAEQGFDSAKS